MSERTEEFARASAFRRQTIEPIWTQMVDTYRLKKPQPLEEWQNASPAIRLPVAIDAITAFSWQTLISAGEQLFELRDRYPADVLKQAVLTALKNRIADHVESAGLMDELFLQLTRAGLIYGIVGVKAPFEIVETLNNFSKPPTMRATGKQRVELIFPPHIYRDPTGLDRYVMTISKVAKSALVELAEKNPDVYEVGVVKELKWSNFPFGTDNRQYLTQASTDEERGIITLLEVWGGIPTRDGGIGMKQSWCALADGKFIVKPRYVTQWTGKPPIILAGLNPRPFEPYPLPYLYYFYETAESLAQMKRVLRNKNTWRDLPIVSIWGDKVGASLTADELEIYPGQFLDKDTGERVLEVNTELGKLDYDFFAAISSEEQEFQLTGHNELLHGAPAPKGRTTAAEMNIRQSMMSAQINFFIQTLERFILRPLFNYIRVNVLQYDDPALWLSKIPTEVFPRPEAKEQYILNWQMSRLLRYAFAQDQYITVTGLTASLKREQAKQSLSELVALLVRNPGATYASGLSLEKTLRELIFSFGGIQPENLFGLTEQEQAMLANTAQASILLGGGQ